MIKLVRASLALCVLWAFALQVRAEAVDFALPDIEGNTHKLSDYRGKWVLVNYWATWCPPCREELPELEMFHNSHKDKDAIVLGVNMESISSERLKAFVEEQFLSYPTLKSKPAASSELGGIPGLPTSYLVSPEGEVIARQVGPVTAAMLERFISSYSEKKKNEAKP